MRALVLLLLLAGCAAGPSRNSVPPPPGLPAEPEATAPLSGNLAVADLARSARADTEAGRLANAAASLERALRIEPKNPRLWQELARVRLKQGDFAQAESVAARSNLYAGADDPLRAENWRLIAQARESRGDTRGAQAARDIAGRIGP